MNPQDELMHPVGDAPAWSESYYFNFVDPRTKLAMFTRMGFRPGDGWADALHVVYLGGRRVAFTYGRRNIGNDLVAYNGDLNVGNLLLTCERAFGHWRIAYDGPAQDIADAAVLLTRSKERAPGWFEPKELRMTVDFHALYPPHYAGQGERGHFEQTGRVSGEVRIAGTTFGVSGFGVRDKSWGPRDWGAGSATATTPSATTPSATAAKSARGNRAKAATTAPAAHAASAPAPFVNWFSMNFGADLAMGGSCFRRDDGVMRGAGWIQRLGKSDELHNVVIETDYHPDSILHRAVRLTAKTSSDESIAVDGTVLTVCPTKIPMPGGATFVNEGLAEFQCEGKTGYGISEHWHSVRNG